MRLLLLTGGAFLLVLGACYLAICLWYRWLNFRRRWKKPGDLKKVIIIVPPEDKKN